jgi:hypothetical protein
MNSSPGTVAEPDGLVTVVVFLAASYLMVT